jgi:hypothetical protein
VNGSGSGNIDLSSELSGHLTVHKNLSQEVILTTTDKMKLCLQEHRGALEAAHNWQAPLALAATFGSTFLVADFHDKVMPAAFWQAVFAILCLFSIYWTAKNLWTAFRARSSRDINTLIDKIAARHTGINTELMQQVIADLLKRAYHRQSQSPYAFFSDDEEDSSKKVVASPASPGLSFKQPFQVDDEQSRYDRLHPAEENTAKTDQDQRE